MCLYWLPGTATLLCHMRRHFAFLAANPNISYNQDVTSTNHSLQKICHSNIQKTWSPQFSEFSCIVFCFCRLPQKYKGLSKFIEEKCSKRAFPIFHFKTISLAKSEPKAIKLWSQHFLRHQDRQNCLISYFDVIFVI
jgi:hypothetical protein